MNNGSSRRSPLLIAVIGASCCVALFLVLVVGGVGTAIYVRASDEQTSSDDPVDDPDQDPDAPQPDPVTEDPDEEDPVTEDPEDPASSDPEEPAADVVPPPGVAADQPYLELSTSADGPVVDVYVDFLCPPCNTFWQVNGEDLISAALSSEITLRMHPRPMLDSSSQPEGYSGRAANASVCAYAEKSEWWFPAANTLFENQPEAVGLTDEELIDLITEAEIEGDVADCITDGTYLAWLEQVVEADALETTPGTPTVLVDGEQFEDGLYTEGALARAIEAA